MTVHKPIMVKPIIEALTVPFINLSNSSDVHWFVDCTLGGGGHTAAFIARMKNQAKPGTWKILAIDRDLEAVERAKERFQPEISDGLLEVHHCSITGLVKLLSKKPILGVLADLGFSSDQIEDEKRGFSFNKDGPLDMRMNPSEGMSCEKLLKTLSENELERILREYGEERFSRRIARAILVERQQGRASQTTQELSHIIIRAIPKGARHQKVHASTRTFQALRIAVNNEIEELDSLLKDVILLLSPGGRAAIISFHSLEDRRVKETFKRSPEIFRQLTKKPIIADDEEIRENPRARSAKLRIAERM